MNTIFKQIAWTALAVTMVAGGVRAQETTTRAADPEHSEGRIFLSSSSKPQLQVNVGVGRVSGRVKEQVGSSPTAIEFTIYPANREADKLDVGDRAQDPDFTVISFHSKRIEDLDGKTYRASGKLTVTYVESTVTYGPAESYSGPVYGPARTYSVSREVSFDFQPVQHAGSGGAGYTEWIASSTVNGAAFPALLQAVASTTWPKYVNNEQCSIPANVGEDYSGPSCSGDVVATEARTDVHCVMPTTTGEGFSGEVCDGSPLRVPSQAELSSTAAQNADKNNRAGYPIADEVKLVVSLRVSGLNTAAAGDAGE